MPEQITLGEGPPQITDEVRRTQFAYPGYRQAELLHLGVSKEQIDREIYGIINGQVVGRGATLADVDALIKSLEQTRAQEAMDRRNAEKERTRAEAARAEEERQAQRASSGYRYDELNQLISRQEIASLWRQNREQGQTPFTQGDIDSLIRNLMASQDVPSYDKGGPVRRDALANIHAGEYVVPKGGALVYGSGGAMDEQRIVRLLVAALREGTNVVVNANSFGDTTVPRSKAKVQRL